LAQKLQLIFIESVAAPEGAHELCAHGGEELQLRPVRDEVRATTNLEAPSGISSSQTEKL
jgi:hypothetical protein